MTAMRLTLRWRVAITLGFITFALTGLLAVITWNLATGYMQGQREESANRQAAVNLRLIEASIRSDSSVLDELLNGLAGDPGSTILVSGPDGWLSGGRQVDPVQLPADLLEQARQGAGGWQIATVGGLELLVVALPLAADDAIIVELFPLSELEGVTRFLTVILAAGVILSGLLGLGLGWWASRRALRPLTELTASAAKFAAGDLQARLPDRSDPDLAALASTFNATVDSLEQRIRRDTRFAGDVSHELRSPLTTMVNAVEVLRHRRAELPPAAAQAADLLADEVQRFQRMVLDLLEISRVDQDVDERSLESVDVAVLIANVAGTVDGVPPPVVERPPPPVLADRRRLVRVVANLLENAQRHGGGVVRLGVTERAGRARLEVDDNGPGVPAELRDRVFDRFARAGARGDDGGSGLGLALVAQHVGAAQGAAWVEDRPGGGARFVVELPGAGP